MITFELSEPAKKPDPTFAEVKFDQFFIDPLDYMSQKVGKNSYNTIANSNGVPFASFNNNVSPSEIIKKILPHVAKINFY